MIRNLLYNLTPFTGSNWLWNIQELFKRIHIFNGRRIFGVAYGEGCDSTQTVTRVLDAFDDNYMMFRVPVENTLWENTRFIPMFRELSKKYDPSSITFYGHNKGVTRSQPEHVHKGYNQDICVHAWAQAMYRYNLDQPYLEQIEEAFKKGFHCAGSFRRFGQWLHFPKESKWHYSGNFFWTNQTELFKRDWTKIAPTKFGPEAYLGTLFDKKESSVIYADKLRCEPYSPECLKFLGLLP